MSAQDEDDGQPLTDKPEPDKNNKQAAAQVMEAYKEKPTVVLPGSGAAVTGTALNEWLDADGNPRFELPDNAGPEYKARAAAAMQEQIEKDKALNVRLMEAVAVENKGERR